MECEEYTSESDDSSVGVNVSRLITEEDLIDSLFFTCDVDNNGQIPVSRLVEYLKFTAGHSLEDSAVDKLCDILDPTNMDLCITLEKYRSGVADWIEKLQQQNNNESDSSSPDGDPYNEFFSPNPDRGFPSHDPGKPQRTSSPELQASPARQIFKGGAGDADSGIDRPSLLNKTHFGDIDMADLLNKLAEVQFSNRKLQEENGKLRKQLVGAEDTATQQAAQVVQLQKQEKIHQQANERLQELRKENEELKCSLVASDDSRKQTERQLQAMHKTQTHIETQMENLQSELSRANADFEMVKADNVSLQVIVNEQKQMKCQAQEMFQEKNTQLIQKGSVIDEMQQALTEFNKVNENLRFEKTELELQLSQTQQELASAQIKVDSLGGSYNSSGENETSDGKPTDDEDDEPMPAPLRLFSAASASSTPCKKDSICSELRSVIHDAPDMPSPLCDKELESVLQDMDDTDDSSKLGSKSAQDIEIDEIIQTSHKYSKKAARVAVEFKQKKEVVLQQINELTKPQKIFDSSTSSQSVSVSNKHTEAVKAKLQREINMFAKKIASLAASNQNYQTRIMRLTEAVKALKDQNKEIEEQHRETLIDIENRSREVAATLQQEVEKMTNLLEKETESRRSLEQQMGKVQTDLIESEVKHRAAEERAQHLHQQNQSMCAEIEQVRKWLLNNFQSS